MKKNHIILDISGDDGSFKDYEKLKPLFSTKNNKKQKRLIPNNVLAINLNR